MARNKMTDGLRQKPNGVWERAEIINGKRRWFSSLDPEEVWKKRNAAIGEAEEEQEAGPSFDTVANAYEDAVQDMKYGTRKVYLPAIKRSKDYFVGRRIKDIEPYEISNFLKSLSGMSRTTVLNQKTVLNGIFQSWVDSSKWRGNRNVAKLTTVPHGLKKGKRSPPTEDQVQIVKDHHMDPDALPAVVYLCTGERKGEACGIQLKDINFDSGIIHMRKHVELIGNRPHVLDGAKTEAGVRDVPLLKMLREALAPLRDLQPDTYILGRGENPLSGSQYSHLWIAFWRKHGMAHSRETTEKHMRHGVSKITKRTVWTADVCAHQFRHEYVCMLAEVEVPEAIAIQIVGHANAKMIHEVYMSLKPKMVNDTGEKLNALLDSVHI